MKDIFADTPYGKIALRKLAPVADNFKLYEAELIDDTGTIKVTGACFRMAKTGKNKGKLSILIKGTERSTCVTAEEHQ